jgi:hypothetical protein
LTTSAFHKVCILHHDSHILSAHSDYCETCGQRLPSAQDGYATWERQNKNKRVGIGISIACTCWACCTTCWRRRHMPMKPPPVKGGQMVYIAPLDPKKSVKPTPNPNRPSRSRRPSASRRRRATPGRSGPSWKPMCRRCRPP